MHTQKRSASRQTGWPPFPILHRRCCGTSLARLIAAVPDFVLVGVFLRAALWPAAVGESGTLGAFLILVMEFLLIVSSALVGGFFTFNDQGSRIALVLGFSFFPFCLAIVFANDFHSWHPINGFILLTVKRLLFIIQRERRALTRAELHNAALGWTFSALIAGIVLLFSAIITPWLTNHYWGQAVVDRYMTLTGDVRGHFGLLLVAGIPYFLVHAVRELFFRKRLEE
ncbi:MAG: hypothetical protein ACYC6A_03430 [Armatimonadota bacterium]